MNGVVSFAAWLPRFIFQILQAEPCFFYLFVMWAASISKENWRHEKMGARAALGSSLKNNVSRQQFRP